MKELTEKEKINRLEYELQKSRKINLKLSVRLSEIELELADLSVRFDEVAEGFKQLQDQKDENKEV